VHATCLQCLQNPDAANSTEAGASRRVIPQHSFPEASHACTVQVILSHATVLLHIVHHVVDQPAAAQCLQDSKNKDSRVGNLPADVMMLRQGRCAKNQADRCSCCVQALSKTPRAPAMDAALAKLLHEAPLFHCCMHLTAAAAAAAAF
jgi:hypothetical protein